MTTTTAFVTIVRCRTGETFASMDADPNYWGEFGRSAAAHSRTGPPRTSSLAKVQVLKRHGEAGSGSRTCICGLVSRRPNRWTIPAPLSGESTHTGHGRRRAAGRAESSANRVV
jgi:hypothetical protein